MRWVGNGEKSMANSNQLDITHNKPAVPIFQVRWGNFVYRGFNVSKVGKPALTEDDFDDFREAFKIYVPKN